MPRTLPLELQLEIIEQALPPPTFPDSRERRDYLISLALVHRSWTKTALKGPLQPLKLDVGNEGGHEDALRAWSKENGGRQPRALVLTLKSDASRGQVDKFCEQLKASCADVSELALLGTPYLARSLALNEVFPNLSRLTLVHNKKWIMHFADLPNRLSYLFASAVPFYHHNLYGKLRTFSHLTTLLFADVSLSDLPNSLFTFFPQLSILGRSNNTPTSPSSFIAKAPMTPIRHLLFEGVVGSLVGVARAILPPLASLTIVNPPGGIAGLEAWCEEGVELMYVVADKEWKFDLEMWSFLRE